MFYFISPTNFHFSGASFPSLNIPFVYTTSSLCCSLFFALGTSVMILLHFFTFVSPVPLLFFPPVCFGFFHFKRFSKMSTDLCLIIHISKCGTKVILGMWWGRKPTSMRTFPTLNRDTCRHYFS